jgi:hypothetical protein
MLSNAGLVKVATILSRDMGKFFTHSSNLIIQSYHLTSKGTRWFCLSCVSDRGTSDGMRGSVRFSSANGSKNYRSV